MADYWIHDADARLDYAFDWTAWLGDDLITNATVTVTPDTLTAEAPAIDGGRVTVWLAGGTAGQKARMSCRITTAAGRVDERTRTIYITER